MGLQEEALKGLGKHEVLKRHDDGDLTVQDENGCLHVVTTEGETFTEQSCACLNKAASTLSCPIPLPREDLKVPTGAGTVIHFDKPSADMQRLLGITFPEYTGRKFKVEYVDKVSFPQTQWSGGTRSRYKMVKLEGMEHVSVPEAPFLQPSRLHQEAIELPPGYVVVEHSIFMGKDMGITFLVNPREAIKLVPETTRELTREQKIVLYATRGLKSSYAGISNFRFHEAHERTGISQEQYETAKQELIKQGLLNKAGAITAEGKNQVEGIYDFRDIR